MRAPLSNIIMIIELLLYGERDETQVKNYKKYYKQIKVQAVLLLNFVQDILDIR
mgnify:CR=1 FL=1